MSAIQRGSGIRPCSSGPGDDGQWACVKLNKMQYRITLLAVKDAHLVSAVNPIEHVRNIDKCGEGLPEIRNGEWGLTNAGKPA